MYTDLTISEYAWLATEIASYSPDVIPYFARALGLHESPPCDEAKEQFVLKMLLTWNKKMVKLCAETKTEMELRRVLARKLLELGYELCCSSNHDAFKDVPVENQEILRQEMVANFEKLAREVDIHGKYIIVLLLHCYYFVLTFTHNINNKANWLY